MALPLAPIRTSRNPHKNGFREKVEATASDPDMMRIIQAAKAGDCEMLKSLLPKRTRLNRYQCFLLEGISSFKILTTWISRAPHRYCVESKMRLTADQVRVLYAAAGRGVILEFSDRHMRMLLKEDPKLYERIKKRITRDDALMI